MICFYPLVAKNIGPKNSPLHFATIKIVFCVFISLIRLICCYVTIYLSVAKINDDAFCNGIAKSN